MWLSRITRLLKKQTSIKNSNEPIAQEIFQLQRRLQKFDISFSSLIGYPSGVEKQILIAICKQLARNTESLDNLLAQRAIGLQQLSNENTGICPKVLEVNYPYIVTMSTIYYGPYPLLRAYLNRSDTNFVNAQANS